MENPKVSIIIPVYNYEKYVRECVESALSQDYENLEVIVVDDGSTDATPEILKSFEQKIRYIRQENRGTAAALNVGLRLARGSLVAWLSSDDVYLPGKIRAQVEKLQEEPDLALVYTDWIMIDAEGRELQVIRSSCPSPERFIREMLICDFVSGSSILLKKECFERAGYFDETLRAVADADMWFRLLKHGYRFGHVPKPLVKYRHHPSNQTHNYRLMQVYKDQVRLKVIEMFSAEELFSDLAKSSDFDEAATYEKLAWTLAQGFHFRAAKAALQKASHNDGFLLRRLLLSSALRVLDTQLFLELFARVRNRRRLWLDRQLIRKSLRAAVPSTKDGE